MLKILLQVTKSQRMEDKLFHSPLGFLPGPVGLPRAENTSSLLHIILAEMLLFIGTQRLPKMFA